jgi:hypothetical protein
MRSVLFILFYFCVSNSQAQFGDIGNRVRSLGSGAGNASRGAQANTDSAALGFEIRDDAKDSLILTFKVLDSTRIGRLDSVFNNIDKFYSAPQNYLVLGNNGAAATPIIYTPNTKAGFSTGLHAFDVYKLQLADTRFYKTNRPYTLLDYQLAGGREQTMGAFHTQNPRPNLNFGLSTQLISAPGFFLSQGSYHTQTRLFTNYQSKRKRYNLYFTTIGNKARVNENGGITNNSFLLEPNKKSRFAVPVRISNLGANNPGNPFSTAVNTGNIQKESIIFLRQSYDLGKRDSIIINDTTTEYLFYSKLRIQHTFTYQTNNYNYVDGAADSAFYRSEFNYKLDSVKRKISITDNWRILRNNFALYQFPDTKNSAQFFMAGITYENIKGQFSYDTSNVTLNNLITHFEYRNRTRNKLWNLQARGDLYLAGFNNGDYEAQVLINRYLNKKLGNVEVFFKNTNRTPAYLFNTQSSFNFTNNTIARKENITQFGISIQTPFANINFKNTLITNLAFFKNNFITGTYNNVINLTQITADKVAKLSKRWFLYSTATMQLVDKAAPVRVPLLYTRNRLAYEGVFYKNLNLSTGLDVRYFTPFKANGYNPVGGIFAQQDTTTIKNLPDVTAYLHFRIRNFTMFLRFENLNTIYFKNGFGFVNNNFAAPLYPTQGMLFRLGLKWGFVN